MARPTISLQAAIGPGTALTNPFIIGTSLIDGTDVITGREIVGQGSWQELGDRCYRVSTRRGRQRIYESYNAGTLAATLDNTDGALDPAWTAGPYTDSGVSRVKAMAGVYLEATYNGVTYPIYTGFADAWKPMLSYPEGGGMSLTATDAFKIFTKLDPLEQTAVGAGEATGARINRILELADWSESLRDVQTGNATHQATTLAQPIISQLKLAAASERGEVYMGADGKVVFRERIHRYTAPQSITVQWTIGDATTELNPVSFDPLNDDALIYNDVNVSRVGGTTITKQDPLVALYPYLAVSYNRTDLTLDDDIQVDAYAAEVLRTSKDGGYRVSSFTLAPDADESLWPLVLGARFGDRVAVNLTHPFTGIRFTGNYFIEGVDHDIPVLESGGEWITTFYVASAAAYPTNPFIVGTSLIDGTDVIV